MTTRPQHVAQTSKQVKKDYKNNGPRLSESQNRRLERGVELDQRAARIKAQEQRKIELKRKREQKETKEREVRRQLGVGQATQLAGFNLTQAQLKNGMEAFLGLKKKADGGSSKDRELARKLAAVVGEEPWDECISTDLPAQDLLNGPPPHKDSWIDDDLDDETLLEIHDHVISDAVVKPPEPVVKQAEAGKSAMGPASPLPLPRTPVATKKDYARMHGPINKSIEIALDALPHPLVELLSIDAADPGIVWKPSNSLLHMLNPVGLPIHRLRVKIGCTVIALRDLNTSSQLSRSSHLRLLRIEPERLECLVLDGQLAGTKTILTRVPFRAKYRNDKAMPFQRLQFPIRVVTGVHSAHARDDSASSSFKPHALNGQRADSSTTIFRKPMLPASNSKGPQRRNPTFKVPRSRSETPQTKNVVATKSEPAASLDVWDDFLDSATQIARDLSSDIPNGGTTANRSTPPPFSTQDFNPTLEDLHQHVPRRHTLSSMTRQSDTGRHRQSRHDTAGNRQAAPKLLMHPPQHTTPRTTPSPCPKPSSASKLNPSSRATTFHLDGSKPVQGPSTKFSARGAIQSAASKPCWNDFGLSTQEVVSFFDDDEFSSPTITV